MVVHSDEAARELSSPWRLAAGKDNCDDTVADDYVYISRASEFTLTIRSTETVHSLMETYTCYCIDFMTSSPSFRLKKTRVRRRFSDFVWLRKVLNKIDNMRSPPSLPRRRFWNVLDAAFVQTRQRQLRQWLYTLLSDPIYLSCSALHLFLQTELTVPEIQAYLEGKTPEDQIQRVWANHGKHYTYQPHNPLHNDVHQEPTEIRFTEEDLRCTHTRTHTQEHPLPSQDTLGAAALISNSTLPDHASEDTSNAVGGLPGTQEHPTSSEDFLDSALPNPYPSHPDHVPVHTGSTVGGPSTAKKHTTRYQDILDSAPSSFNSVQSDPTSLTGESPPPELFMNGHLHLLEDPLMDPLTPSLGEGAKREDDSCEKLVGLVEKGIEERDGTEGESGMGEEDQVGGEMETKEDQITEDQPERNTEVTEDDRLEGETEIKQDTREGDTEGKAPDQPEGKPDMKEDQPEGNAEIQEDQTEGKRETKEDHLEGNAEIQDQTEGKREMEEDQFEGNIAMKGQDEPDEKTGTKDEDQHEGKTETKDKTKRKLEIKEQNQFEGQTEMKRENQLEEGMKTEQQLNQHRLHEADQRQVILSISPQEKEPTPRDRKSNLQNTEPHQAEQQGQPNPKPEPELESLSQVQNRTAVEQTGYSSCNESDTRAKNVAKTTQVLMAGLQYKDGLDLAEREGGGMLELPLISQVFSINGD